MMSLRLDDMAQAILARILHRLTELNVPERIALTTAMRSFDALDQKAGEAVAQAIPPLGFFPHGIEAAVGSGAKACAEIA